MKINLYLKLCYGVLMCDEIELHTVKRILQDEKRKGNQICFD